MRMRMCWGRAERARAPGAAGGQSAALLPLRAGAQAHDGSTITICFVIAIGFAEYSKTFRAYRETIVHRPINRC